MLRQGDLLQRKQAQDEGGWQGAPIALLVLNTVLSIIFLFYWGPSRGDAEEHARVRGGWSHTG